MYLPPYDAPPPYRMQPRGEDITATDLLLLPRHSTFTTRRQIMNKNSANNSNNNKKKKNDNAAAADYILSLAHSLTNKNNIQFNSDDDDE